MLSESSKTRAHQLIRKQYDDNKRVFIAPSRCKLYISRSSEIIDFEGKTSPNWFLFATGLTTVVYDLASRELTLNLFDLKSVRLIWMLKLTDDSHMYAPNSNFHVINTKSDLSEHVGLLYDSKDVATIFLDRLSKLLAARSEESGSISESRFKTIRMSAGSPDMIIGCFPKADGEHPTSERSPVDEKRTACPGKKQNKIIRSLSMYFKRSSRHCTKSDSARVEQDYCQQEKFEAGECKGKKEVRRHGSPEMLPTNSCKLNENRAREKRRTRFSSRSKTLGAESFPKWPTLQKIVSSENHGRRNSNPDFIVDRVEDIFPSRERILSQGGLEVEDKGSEKSDRRFGCGENAKLIEAPKSAKRIGIKVGRSLSERRPNISSNAEHGRARNEAVVKLREGGSRTPRATSDTLLLKGNTLTCMFETGHMAKYQRERKQWMAILEKGNVQTTDLCVTEL